MEEHLNLYRIFYTVANTENISRAARQLFISQPSLSKALKKLESDLGVTLFTRSSRGVRLTEEGKLLYDYVREAFTSLQQGEALIRRRQEQGVSHIRIGVSTTLCKYMLLPYLKSFTRQFPNIRITILCQSSNQTMELLDRGQIDLGLVGIPENPKKYRFFQLEEIEDIFVATDNYIEQMGLGSLWDTRKIFETASVMLLDKQNMTRQYIDDYMEKNHLLTKNLLVVSTMDLIIEFSKIGLGIGCVIKEFVKDELEDGLLTEIPLGFPIHKRKIGFVTAKQAYMSPGVESFITQWEELSLSPGDRK
ncbi:LysR family transcriptional regulator [Catenibacillus scindens]|uniref:LysR family transcriptional regulator n=1 Tax=Catenibacillus scindens TaxID=673271 RepID=UPI00320A584B